LSRGKQELFEVQKAFVRDVRNQNLGVFSDCQVHPCFEGHSHSILRATGDGETHDFEIIEGLIEVKLDDDLDAVFAKLAEMGADIADKMKVQSFKTIDETMARLGRTINGKGKPWTEQFLEILSNVMIPLNDDGKLDLSGLRIVAGPEIMQQAAREMRNLEADPAKNKAFDERYQAILAQKEEEARALEANRMLVG
jgi:hypothetical protein